jgi:hypothetical protein
MSYEFIVLAHDLRTLLGMPVVTRSDLRAWNELAFRVQSAIRGNPEVSNQVPHELWHFFSDADVRRDDPEYGREQCQLAWDFLKRLECLAEAHSNQADAESRERVIR